jgi:hypothetical protein
MEGLHEVSTVHPRQSCVAIGSDEPSQKFTGGGWTAISIRSRMFQSCARACAATDHAADAAKEIAVFPRVYGVARRLLD